MCLRMQVHGFFLFGNNTKVSDGIIQSFGMNEMWETNKENEKEVLKQTPKIASKINFWLVCSLHVHMQAAYKLEKQYWNLSEVGNRIMENIYYE